MITVTSDAPASAIEWRTRSIKVSPPTVTSGFKGAEPARNLSPRPAARTPARSEVLMRPRPCGKPKEPEVRRAGGDEGQPAKARDNRATPAPRATRFSFRSLWRDEHRGR